VLLGGTALARKAWLFARSDRGGERAAAIYSLTEAAKLNAPDPEDYLRQVRRRRRMAETYWLWRDRLRRKLRSSLCCASAYDGSFTIATDTMA
jgi:hypothetical protein